MIAAACVGFYLYTVYLLHEDQRIVAEQSFSDCPWTNMIHRFI